VKKRERERERERTGFKVFEQFIIPWLMCLLCWWREARAQEEIDISIGSRYL